MLGDGIDLEWTALPAPPGELYEGPQWLPDPGVFQWVDILGHSLHRWTPGSELVESRVLDLEFTTVALPLDGARSIVASRSSLHEYDWEQGTLTTLGSWDFAPDVRFNDGAISPDGEIYIGSMSMDRRPGAGSLFRFSRGRLDTVLTGIGISNGLGWGDGLHAYYVDSLVPQVDMVDLHHPELARRVVVQLQRDEEPDGLTVTPEGLVLVALWGGGRLAVIGPNGTRRPDCRVPPRSPTSIVLGGAATDLVLLTSASYSDANTTECAQVFVAQRMSTP